MSVLYWNKEDSWKVFLEKKIVQVIIGHYFGRRILPCTVSSLSIKEISEISNITTQLLIFPNASWMLLSRQGGVLKVYQTFLLILFLYFLVYNVSSFVQCFIRQCLPKPCLPPILIIYYFSVYVFSLIGLFWPSSSFMYQ